MLLGFYKYTIGSPGWLKAWAIYLMAFPFYIFPAGSIQPSDMFIAATIALYLFMNGVNFYPDNRKVFLRFLRFCIYVLLVNLGMTIAMLGTPNDALPWFIFCSFYFYNLAVIGLTLALYRQYGRAFLYTTVYACITACFLQVGLSFVLPTAGGGIRESFFFTNPNQLGYYSLCGLAIVLTLETLIKIPRNLVYLSFLFFGYFAIASVSKAAMGAMIILFGVYLIANKIFSLANISALVFLGIVGIFILPNTQVGRTFQQALEIREINEQGRPDEITEWQYRGYDRMTNHPSYLMLGAGEGYYERFDTFIDGHEMHSSIGTIIFSYGIPGTILFGLFVLSLLRKLPWYYLIYSLPLFSYGVTHMGLRFTIFWIALAMFPIIRMEIMKQKFLQKKKRFEALKDYNHTSISKIPA